MAATREEGGQVKSYPCAEGSTASCVVVLTWQLEVLAILMGGTLT